MRQILSLAFLALLGCTERIQMGGFETGDLQARVQRPNGAPVPAARVWLVRSRGDSAPATVVDSALTDTAGWVRFLYGTDADLSRMGLDARSGDSLGIAPSAFAHATIANVTIRETKSVQIGRDSAGDLPVLHVPGSRFASRAAENGEAAVISLPQGTWDLAIRTPAKAQVLRALAVTRDTVVSGLSGFPTVSRDTTSKASDTLREGPDIALDSFRVDGVAHYADATLPPAWKWVPTGEGDESYWHSDSTFVSEDTGYTTLSSHAYTRFRPEVPDTLKLQGFASIQSPSLPATGALALQFAFPRQLAADTNLVRRIRLLDTLGHGVELFLQRPTRSMESLALDSFGLVGYVATDVQRSRTDTANLLEASTWYFSWTTDSVTVRDQSGVVGAARLRSGSFSVFRLILLVRTKHFTGSTAASISRIRLYKPR